MLENKTIGHNIQMYRKIRDVKAFDIADRLGMKEATYTRYERGETAITIDFIQQVAEVLKVDPLMLLAVHPANFFENIHNSPNAEVGNYIGGNLQTYDEKQIQIMTKLFESLVGLSEKITALLDSKKI